MCRHLLGDISETKFYRLVQNGDLKIVKQGRRTYVTNLEEYVSSLPDKVGIDNRTGRAGCMSEAKARPGLDHPGTPAKALKRHGSQRVLRQDGEDEPEPDEPG